MKILSILIISLISFSIQAQEWFDKSCKNIDDSFIVETFNTTQPRNILKVIVNQAGVLELNGEERQNMSEIALKEWVLEFITNPNNDKKKAEKPENVFVQLKSFNNDAKTLNSLKSYIQDVYLYLWDKHAEEKYSSTYIDLNCKKRAKIFSDFPLFFVTDLEKNKLNKKRFGVGVPTFGGDVIDN